MKASASAAQFSGTTTTFTVHEEMNTSLGELRSSPPPATKKKKAKGPPPQSAAERLDAKINANPETAMAEAEQALNCISKGDIVELKSLNNPPPGVD